MAPQPGTQSYYPAPPPPWDPRYVGRKPDLTQAWTADAFPTPSVPLYTNLPTIPWSSELAILSSSIKSEIDSMLTVTSYPPQRNPVSASETPVFTPYHKGKSISGVALGIAAAISALAILFILTGICLVLCRKSRKKRLAAQRTGSTAEMAQTPSHGSNAQYAETRAYMRPPSTEPPPAINVPSTVITSSSQQHLMPEAPVLLSTTMDQSYYTGIDTSDGLSIHDSRRLSTATAAPGYASSTISEPPPPYRPRSVMSRENSMRLSVAPPSYGPRLSVRSTNLSIVQSPFDDPEEDSPVSEIAPSPTTGVSRVRDMEEMSDVSELSYQEDPAVPRSTV